MNDVEDWLTLADRKGWRVRIVRAHHLQWLPPEGAMVITGGNDMKASSLANARSALKRAGLFQ